MNYDEILNNTEKRSVDPGEKKPVVIRVKEVGKKVLIMAAVTTTALSTVGCAKYNEEFGYSQQQAYDYNRE